MPSRKKKDDKPIKPAKAKSGAKDEKRDKTGAKKTGSGARPKKMTAGDRKSAPDKQSAGEKQPAKKTPFPIVGIGASAGGLEALEAFFENLPADTGMAFAVITHTDPQHTSLLPDILRRKTSIPVKQAEHGMRVVPDTIYLSPSQRDMYIDEDTLGLQKRPQKDEMHMPVDLFLKTLALIRDEWAAAVILSGTGTDGTYGVRAIKEKSGLVIVQTPESARHAGMPKSALDTGLVDTRLVPADMPGRLKDYFSRKAADGHTFVETKEPAAESIKPILRFLYNQTRQDFSLYKEGTLIRRIQRRMTVHNCSSTEAYKKILLADGRELRALFQDLLIGVTSFFRDNAVFDYLGKQVLPDLLSAATDGDPLRVWVPGCATGEEAYSLAIVLKECLEKYDLQRELQIFATDIDGRAIDHARQGYYLQNISADVSEGRLKRFFSKEGDRYRVKREIRDPIVFAEQNLLRDPPFSDLDLMVCRNLLIYIKRKVQEKLIPLFHHTLKKNGILFLGDSENIGPHTDLFEAVSRRHAIYRKIETAVPPQVDFPIGGAIGMQHGPTAARRDRSPIDDDSLAEAVKDALVEEFAPACVVVSAKAEILHTHGRTGRYLELAQGKPRLNIADMAREGLRFPLIAALRKVRDETTPVQEKKLRVRTSGGHQWLNLIVKRFNRLPQEDAVMVVFEPLPDPERQAAQRPVDDAGQDAGQDRLQALETELIRVREDYQGAMEELESSNEELHSANEEMQSSNEELQSTNEELESSREELQSLNEELSTVNSELQKKIEELDQAHAAMANVLDNTQIAVIFLDNELRVVRFTDEASRLVNLIDSDPGRPFAHISDKFEDADLPEKAGRVLKSLEPLEEEVKTADGRWYRMKIMVHRSGGYGVEGVVLTFVNIDAQKQAQQRIEEMNRQALESARHFAESIIDTVRESLLVLDADMRVVTANRRFYDTFVTDSKQTEGRVLFGLGDGQWDVPELRNLLQKTVERAEAFENYTVEHRFADIGLKKMLLNGRVLKEEDKNKTRILLAIEDATDR